jgi:hypothetical protein
MGAQQLCHAIQAAGGGVFNRDSTATFVGCTFQLNSAHAEDPSIGDFDAGIGGGLCDESSSSVLIDCVFENNDAGSAGGAGWTDGSAAQVVNCRFLDNHALGGGGGLASASTLHVVNCLFAENLAAFGSGGGLIVSDGSATLANCTIAMNEAAFGPGGIDAYAGTVVRNSILWGNLQEQIPLSFATVQHSCVQGGYPGPGNISTNPLFVLPAIGDFSLQPGSPCIDAGHNWALPTDVLDLDEDGDTAELVPLDLAGSPRFSGATASAGAAGCGVPVIVDMGAYEAEGRAVATVRFGDVNGDGAVDVSDLVEVVLGWGPCKPPEGCCLADLNLDGAIGVEDLVAVILHWGE